MLDSVYNIRPLMEPGRTQRCQVMPEERPEDAAWRRRIPLGRGPREATKDGSGRSFFCNICPWTYWFTPSELISPKIRFFSLYIGSPRSCELICNFENSISSCSDGSLGVTARS